MLINYDTSKTRADDKLEIFRRGLRGPEKDLQFIITLFSKAQRSHNHINCFSSGKLVYSSESKSTRKQIPEWSKSD